VATLDTTAHQVDLARPEIGSQVGAQLVKLLIHPVVLRVHAHDPLARECPEITRVACDAAVVIDSVVWSA
jgi:hypothetical protein